MATVTGFPEVPVLTQLERIGAKGYSRRIMIFSLPEDYDLDSVAAVLQTSYEATKKRIGAFRCEAVPDPDAGQAGVLKAVEMPADDEAGRVAVRDLRATYGHTYAQLRERGFPVSALDADTLMRRGVWAKPGERLPISLWQANFITGGLVLTWAVLHVFGDGTTFYNWTRIWAEEVRRAEGCAVDEEPLVFDSAMWTDRERVMRPSGRLPASAERHPEYAILPFTPQGAPPKMLSGTHRGQVFYLSPDSLRRLKEEAHPRNAIQGAGDVSFVSTNDAVNALIWRTVMVVQHAHRLPEIREGQTSIYNVALDLRQRTGDSPVHKATMGCWLGYAAAEAPLHDMLDETKMNMADLAVRVRRAVNALDRDHADSVCALVESLEDVDRLVPRAYLDAPGFNCASTAWRGFPLYAIEWGPRLGRIRAVRTPHVGLINGAQLVFPETPDGGWEVLVGVEGEHLDSLLREPLLRRFAEAR